MEPIDQSDDPVTHMRDVEIQQVTEPKAPKPKIAQQLPSVDGKDSFDLFEFEHDSILDEQVDAIAVVDRQILIADRDHDLHTDAQA